MKKILYCFALLATLLAGCDTVDDDRIPPIPAYLNFGNAGLWNTYGVSGYGQFRYFDRSSNIPGNYQYKVNDYTGYGGVLLIYGIDGPMAYDRACPVEATKKALLTIDTDTYEAVCNTCGSRFNVCEAGGRPIYGKAHELKYGLRRFYVIPSADGYIITSK